MNQPPKEITTPPEGFEWTGEYRRPKAGEWFASEAPANTATFLAWEPVLAKTDENYPWGILRKAKPPTVMVELPRTWAETMAKSDTADTRYVSPNVMRACRAALENEDE